MTRFATIALAGKPNSGKSTLLNALVGEPLAAVSAKPQTTREPVHGLVTEGDIQLLFVDPPGLLEPRYRLQEAMLVQALDALRKADAVVYLHPAGRGAPPALSRVLTEYERAMDLPEAARASSVVAEKPVLTVVSKADLLGKPIEDGPGGSRTVEARDADTPGPASTGFDRVLVSASTSTGLGRLLEWCRAQAKPGPFRYAADDVGTQPLRFFAAEFVREAAFAVLDQELPYALAATVDEFREGETPVYIRVIVYVERVSQKGMVIGAGGRTLKRLGETARARIEALLGTRVYLDLWVKVWPKWRRSPEALRQFGFPLPVERTS